MNWNGKKRIKLIVDMKSKFNDVKSNSWGRLSNPAQNFSKETQIKIVEAIEKYINRSYEKGS